MGFAAAAMNNENATLIASVIRTSAPSACRGNTKFEDHACDEDDAQTEREAAHLSRLHPAALNDAGEEPCEQRGSLRREEHARLSGGFAEFET